MDTLTRPEIDAAVAAERRRLADVAAQFDAAQWATQSLCSAWTVAHVAAHLTTTTRVTVPMVLREAIRARGSFDRMEINLARQRVARHSHAELVDLVRRSAQTNRRFPGSGPLDPLMDLVVHGQDIARPLGLTYVSPPAVVSASLAHVAASTFLGGAQRSKGLRLQADSGFTRGEGPLVAGPDLELLLAVSGRPAGLGALAGDGLSTLRARLTPQA